MALQVTVTGKNIDVPEKVKARTTRKLSKVERFDNRIERVDVEFSEERNPRVAETHRVEVTCAIKSHVIRAEASGPDPASAVDRAVDRLERQVKKLKGRQIDRTQHAEGRPAPESVMPIPGAGPDKGPEIVRFKRVEMKPMTADEAVMVMDLLAYDFYLFTNVETHQAAVVYRRRNGDFGLIEPEA